MLNSHLSNDLYIYLLERHQNTATIPIVRSIHNKHPRRNQANHSRHKSLHYNRSCNSIFLATHRTPSSYNAGTHPQEKACNTPHFGKHSRHNSRSRPSRCSLLEEHRLCIHLQHSTNPSAGCMATMKDHILYYCATLWTDSSLQLFGCNLYSLSLQPLQPMRQHSKHLLVHYMGRRYMMNRRRCRCLLQ